jgi:hypothetical protein
LAGWNRQAKRAKACLENNRKARVRVGQDKGANIMGRLLIGLSLFGLLALALWYAVEVWTNSAGPPMPTAGYIAMALGVGFSLVIGGGLMALLFYSNRHGYDEDAKGDHEPD